jgi:hypothetical protein
VVEEKQYLNAYWISFTENTIGSKDSCLQRATYAQPSWREPPISGISMHFSKLPAFCGEQRAMKRIAVVSPEVYSALETQILA